MQWKGVVESHKVRACPEEVVMLAGRWVWVVVGVTACDAPLRGTAVTVGAAVDASVAVVDVLDDLDDLGAEVASSPGACDDVGLWAFPAGDVPLHVVTAPDGDAIVAGRTRMLRLDADRCDIVWEVGLASAPSTLALVGDDVVLAGPPTAPSDRAVGRVARHDGRSGALLHEAGTSGSPRAIGAAAEVWIATRDGALTRMTRNLETVAETRLDPDDTRAAHGERDAFTVGELVVRADGDVIVGARVRRRFVVWRVGADGAVRWRRELALDATSGPRLALDPDGDVFLSGLARARGDRQVVSRMAGADGDEVWSWRSAPGAGSMGEPAPALSLAGGDLVVAGVVIGRSELAPERATDPRADAADLDGFVARFAPHMPVVWTVEVIGGEGDQVIEDAAGDARGRHWIVGRFTREVVVGELALRTVDPAGGGFIARRPLGIGW